MICESRKTGSSEAEIFVVTVFHELNTENVFEFEDHLKNLLDNGAVRIVLDLQEVKYICSRGIGIITHALTQTRKRGGDLRLARINNFVTKLLEVIKLDSIFKVFPNLDMAEKSFAS
ncbi:MAG: hypothetical protein CVV64_02515 [Candidatus Wallbacteria bacterium HGW-Wallbacteria-1]|jgi:anti-anti-sigma factor|uniref:Anti-sigma factor antagonist n=1 Tax=Candidatus Wallbacteria bacterium HGW-Wallbacteria-1 TaxID=2013854 RepID=A0A2N1PVE3_9BACT|nr:MAG: hypothetical protein CVV64_02515 [Candidatus Wallbacteria bacterium HGW-Wallbacteria-1]